MKKGRGLRSDPAKLRAWQERSRGGLKRTKALESKAPPKASLLQRLKALVTRTPMKKIRPDRIKRLRAMQYGTDGRREWTLSMASCVTGRWGWEGDPMTPSHVLGTRATGAGPAGMVPMLASENVDWDSLDEAKWLEKYGISKPLIRDFAVQLDQQWQALPEEERAEWKRRAA